VLVGNGTNSGGKKRKLSVKELQNELEVSEITLRRWRHQKIGPPYHREANRIWYYRDDLEAWRANNKWN